MYAGASDSEFTELRTFRDFIAGPRTGDIVLSFGDSQLVSALSRDITPIPEALQGVLAEPVFTLGHLDTGADFHSHDEVWVAQVRGRKAWLLAPPTGRELPRGGLPCEVLRATLGERDGHDMENCTVGPGEVLFLPAGWFHNTCNLDDFTLGVGGRGRSHAAHAACNVCDAGGLRRALARDPSALTAVDALQRQPIHACTAADCPEGIRHLVARGADPSAPVAGGRERGTRPLHYAFCDKPGLAGSAAEALLELGADFSLHSERCGSLLQGAAFHGDQRLVELLLSKGADPAEAVLGTTPLQLAVGNRHAAVARLLRRALGRREGAPRKRRRHRRQDL